jgi:twitching motility two-component system response regulator PilH
MAKILIVDDSPTEMFRFKEILGRHGFDVIEATNGADGVTTAQAELPDLILMDVVMPGVNGFQATRQISRGATTKHIPIVIVSTKDQETDRVWGNVWQQMDLSNYFGCLSEEIKITLTTRVKLTDGQALHLK